MLVNKKGFDLDGPKLWIHTWLSLFVFYLFHYLAVKLCLMYPTQLHKIDRAALSLCAFFVVPFSWFIFILQFMFVHSSNICFGLGSLNSLFFGLISFGWKLNFIFCLDIFFSIFFIVTYISLSLHNWHLVV